MVKELKKSIDAGKVFFGIKQSLKNSAKLGRVCLPSDVRENTMKILENKKVEFDILDLSKEEIAGKLELGFHCEVFGLRK